tara:strand:+ start:1160 stop:3403 length:2244 start_codon:yes stop_codon:yes gene_type:complete
MIVTRRGRNGIIVRRRDENRNRIEETYKSNPFFFVATEDYAPHICNSAINAEHGFKGVYGEELTKVTVSAPENIRDFRSDNPSLRTWEANIPFVNRVLAEEKIMPPNYEHRTWYLDCEWSINTGKLTIMVVYDTYTKEHFIFFTHPDYKAGFHSQFPLKNHPDGLDLLQLDKPALAFSNEKEMLSAFAKLLRQHDPDIITGWNVVNADIKKIVERMNDNGLDPKTLSPLNKIVYSFTDWRQPIIGINVIDLMVAFTHLWIIKNGQLPDKSLATVSSEVLGETKVELQDGHDTYYTDFGTYLAYAIKDVDLLPKLNSMNNAIEHYTAIQHIVGCDIATTPHITKLLTVLALRDEEFNLQIPTKPQFTYEDYQGAEITAVQKAGIFDNVAILDIKAMYHSNVALHNIGHETLSEDGVDCGNGTKFLQGKPSLLLRQMDNMTNLREEYKSKMRAATTDEERKRYDALQFATKSMVASLYGAAGDSKYGLYHPAVAAAITFTSRETLARLRKECEKRGHNVLYSHTDSAFVQTDSPEQTIQLVSEINESMSPIVTEFERWCDSMLLKAKNRYAASVVWTDGRTHEPIEYYKGIELKQKRMFPVMKEAMGLVIFGLLQKKSEEEITTSLVELVTSIVSGEVAFERLCMKGKLERNLQDYSVLSGASAGASWANDYLAKGYRKGSRFLVTLDENGKYIACDTEEDLQGVAKVGYREITKRFIVKKVADYYKIMGWDMQPIENALNGIDEYVWL